MNTNILVLISVDDHCVEPANVVYARMPAKYVHRAWGEQANPPAMFGIELVVVDSDLPHPERLAHPSDYLADRDNTAELLGL